MTAEFLRSAENKSQMIRGHGNLDRTELPFKSDINLFIYWYFFCIFIQRKIKVDVT